MKLRTASKCHVPAFHLRLTDTAHTHHHSFEEAAEGNSRFTNELIGNTYLSH